MSTQALKAAATGAMTTNRKPATLAELITGDSMKKQFALALPKHLNPDRFTRVALTEMRKVPKLMEADPASFMGAIMQCAQLGIEPGGALGHAYLLPFENRRSGKTEVQFILGYKGMIDLARRSGQIVSIEARAVFDQDEFSVSFGLNPDLKHEPAWEAEERGELRAVYAVAKLQGGGIQFEVMGRKEIERIRNESQGFKAAENTARKYGRDANSPWHTHFEEMAKKTVLRRLFKYLPVSIEYAEALEREDRDERMNLVDLAPEAVNELPEVPTFENDPPPANPEPALTYAKVLDDLLRAKTVEALDTAADLIKQVVDDGQRTELNQKYDALRVDLEAKAAA